MSKTSKAIVKNKRATVAMAQEDKKPIVYPRWKNWRLPIGNSTTQAVTAMSKSLDAIRQVLNKGVALLNAVQQIINLLKMFEKVFKASIFSFLDIVIQKIETMLKEIRSTGIYFLDLTTYHWQELDNIEEKQNAHYRAALGHKGDVMTFEKEFAPPKQIGPFISGGIKTEDGVTRWEDLKLNFNYKKESYNEFIAVICNAFNNEYDVPGPSLFNMQGVNKDVAAKVNWQADTHLLRSGRPNFGPDGQLQAYIFVFSMTDVTELLDLINAFALLGIDMVKNNAIKNAISDLDAIKSQKNVIQLYATNIVPISSAELYAIKPYFYGITVGTIFGEFFDRAQELLNMLKSLNYTVDDSIFKIVERVLEGIRQEIQRIMEILDIIEKFIRAIKAFLDLTGISYLQVTSTSGNAGLVEQIRNAQGFGKSDKENKKYDKLQNDITNTQTAIDNNVNDINKTTGNIVTIKNQITQKHFNPDWKPKDFDYANTSNVVWPPDFTIEIQKLYIQLWTLENDPYGEGLAQYKEKELALWDTMSDLQNEMGNTDAHISEMLARAKNREVIDNLGNQVSTLSAQQQQYNIIIDHLQKIKQAAYNWEVYANGVPGQSVGQNLNAKLAQKITLSSPSSQENQLQSDITSLQTSGKDINADGINELSRDQLVASRTATQTSKDRYNNGYDADADGTFEIIPIDTQIANAQAAIDLLDQKYNDPTAPNVPDYETKRAQLVVNRDTLIAEKATINSGYDSTIARLTTIINYIDALTPAEYETHLQEKQDELQQLKNDRNESVIGSTAYNYRQQLNSIDSQIVNYNSSIVTLDTLMRNLNVTINQQKSLVYAEGLEPNLYPYGSGFPGITNPTAWKNINVQVPSATVKGEPCGIKIRVNVPTAYFQNRPNITGSLEDQFLDPQSGIWVNQKQYNQAYLRKLYEQNYITVLTAQKATINAEYSAWLDSNIIAQNDCKLTINALFIQMEIADKNTELNTLQSDRINNLNTLISDINNIYNVGWSQYLYIQDQWYSLNANKKDEQYSFEWDNNETRWLEVMRAWDKANPPIKRTENSIIVKHIDDAIAMFQKQRGDSEIRSDVYEKTKTATEQGEQQRQQEYNQRREKDIQKGKQKVPEWTPDTKMYYGGFLMCWGAPKGDASYFNWSDVVAQSSYDMDSVENEAKDFQKNVTNIFTKWMK
jgi:hypothetical protein